MAVNPMDARKQAANAVRDAQSTDVLLVNAPIERGLDDRIIRMVCGRNCAPNVTLILVTTGGNADAAYRMARCLQNHYEWVTALVSGMCKSAGTLAVIGAHEIAMDDFGELGPLDVQMAKADELWGASSGLTVREALATLETQAFGMMERYFLAIMRSSGGRVTFRTATQIAVEMVVGLLEPIYRQIDPMHVGESGRALQIASDYAERLDRVTDNLISYEGLNNLTGGYSNHSFVIDRAEAETYFRLVRELTEEETKLVAAIGDLARSPNSAAVSRDGVAEYLNDEFVPTPEEGHDHDHPHEGSDEAAGAPGGSTPPDAGHSPDEGEGAADGVLASEAATGNGRSTRTSS